MNSLRLIKQWHSIQCLAKLEFLYPTLAGLAIFFIGSSLFFSFIILRIKLPFHLSQGRQTLFASKIRKSASSTGTEHTFDVLFDHILCRFASSEERAVVQLTNARTIESFPPHFQATALPYWRNLAPGKYVVYIIYIEIYTHSIYIYIYTDVHLTKRESKESYSAAVGSS